MARIGPTLAIGLPQKQQPKGGKMEKKKKQFRPWLTASEVERPTHELKEICKDWDRRTWEAYLIWFEGGRRDKLVKPEIYEFWGNSVHRSIFEDFGYESCPELQSFCDHLLSHLPEAQAFALRKIYLEGKTIRQAAFELNKSHTVITQNKNRALSNLIKSFPLGQLSVGRIVRGSKFFDPAHNNSIWNTKKLGPLKENRSYKPESFEQELLNHPVLQVREFFRTISTRARQYIYLRYWCGLSINEIARKCKAGVNTVEQIVDATVFKLKTSLIEFQDSIQSLAA